ncbi:Crp/Fnr family transcriptional regulator [Clostridium paraputrificum]|uniref:Crp/Fnr family transcriptional regulator n=1 Tax=Clostridium TaxID=1485 RepID=UPI003D336A44
MLTDSDINFLNTNLKFYKKLTIEEREIFNSKSFTSIFPKNSAVFSADKECSGLIIVVKGTLRAFLNSPEGKEITIYRLLDRDTCILSASCIFKNIHFNINIEASEDTEVIILPSKYLDSLSKSNPILQQYILELTQSRFSDVMWTIEQLVFTSFDKRLISYLQDYNSETIKITHDAIARDLGTAREVVSRMLKYFEKEGMVKLSRGTINIIDLKKN